MTIVGVDGCRDGRFAIRVEDDFANDPTADVFPSVRSLTSAWGDASLVLIDIPIGLPSAERRASKATIRRRGAELAGRHASQIGLFCPGRAAIERLRSDGPDSYAACSEANFDELQMGLATQAYEILPKIAKVNQLSTSDAAARSRIREVHPELCF